MEEAEKGEIIERNTKPSSMEEAEKGEIFERNAKLSSMEEAEKGEVFDRNTKPRLDDHPEATAAGAASLFTDDLILEILSRLPARSVNRFQCVSVLWRDLIADPANRKKLPQALAGFLYTSFRSGYHHHFASVSGGAAPFDPSLPYLQPNKYKDMEQVDACNGLLLYRGCTKKLAPWDWIEHDCRFVVCNPATGRWVELPPQPQPQEPAKGRNHIVGVSIYSSRTGAWSRRDSGMAEEVGLLFSSKCVFVGGMMYVIGRKDNEYVLVGVDMEGKVWKTICVPYGRRFGTIGVSQGCLHYVVSHVVSTDVNNEILVSEMTLWCLKDHDSKEFVLKRTASIDKLMSMTGKKYTVVQIHPDCDTIFLLSYGGDTLAAYDM